MYFISPVGISSSGIIVLYKSQRVPNIHFSLALKTSQLQSASFFCGLANCFEKEDLISQNLFLSTTSIMFQDKVLLAD